MSAERHKEGGAGCVNGGLLLRPAGCLDRAVEWRPTCCRPDSTISERQRRKNNIRPKQTRLKALRCVINAQGAFCLRDMLTH